MQSALLVLWQKTSRSYDGGHNENCSVQSNSETKNNMDVTCALDNNQIKSHGEPEILNWILHFLTPTVHGRVALQSKLDVLLLTKLDVFWEFSNYTYVALYLLTGDLLWLRSFPQPFLLFSVCITLYTCFPFPLNLLLIFMCLWRRETPVSLTEPAGWVAGIGSIKSHLLRLHDLLLFDGFDDLLLLEAEVPPLLPFEAFELSPFSGGKCRKHGNLNKLNCFP